MIKIEIADICVGLKLDDAETTRRILDRYADFLSSNGTPEVTVQVEVREGVQFVPLEPGPYVINSSQDGRLTFKSRFEAGSVDMHTRQGELLMAPRGNVENFLRVLYAWRCVYDDALLFHASGVMKDGGSFIFVGPSGAGKTTIAHLSLEHTVLSEDMVIVKKTDGVYRTSGVPFNLNPEALWSNARADLRGVFLLRKDTRHSTTVLSRPKAVAELLSCTPYVVGNPTTSRMAIPICGDLVANVPVKELHFRRDKGFWRVIDETN